MTTETIARPDVVRDLELGRGERRYAHYVDADKIVEASVEGSPLTALCGHVWVPTRDPAKFPVCPECQRLYDLGPEGRMRERANRAE